MKGKLLFLTVTMFSISFSYSQNKGLVNQLENTIENVKNDSNSSPLTTEQFLHLKINNRLNSTKVVEKSDERGFNHNTISTDIIENSVGYNKIELADGGNDFNRLFCKYLYNREYFTDVYGKYFESILMDC